MTYQIWDYGGNGNGHVYETLGAAETDMRTHEDPCFVECVESGKTVAEWGGKQAPKQPDIVADRRGHITPSVAEPAARYQVTVWGEPHFFADGEAAARAYESAPDAAQATLYDTWAEQFVSSADAICGFPRLKGPKTTQAKAWCPFCDYPESCGHGGKWTPPAE